MATQHVVVAALWLAAGCHAAPPAVSTVSPRQEPPSATARAAPPERAGVIRESLVDQAVRRVLRAKCLLGLFADPYRYSDPAREQARIFTPEHLTAAREMARESIVLLKNSGAVLPLPKTIRSLAVIGPLAIDSASSLGSWSAAGRPADAITVLEGIRRALPAGTRVGYARGADVASDDTTATTRTPVARPILAITTRRNTSTCRPLRSIPSATA